jgi:DNA polymerase-3 subunit gamma/tau
MSVDVADAPDAPLSAPARQAQAQAQAQAQPQAQPATQPQYQSLYRRYRPQRFEEVRGQDLTATTLRNAVRDGRIVHAYLFSGPRGTGKTSTARILAKALNCLQPEDGEPCGRCDSCIDIARGASLDVHELDAASNNGVDAMRDLVSRAALATPGKRKVYIIDEVHMLSTAASNALLKTLEEPPDHVVFVLATTDPQKVLPTIRSRTQHFEFHLLEQPVLEALLGDISKDAGLELPDDAIDAAVRRGHGSARDALSVLDQFVASGIVEDDHRFLLDLVQSIVEQDPALALRTVAEAITAGFEAQRLAVELVETLREQFLASVARRVIRPEPDMLAPDGRALLPPARCVRALELVGQAIVDMKEAIDPRTTLEVAMVRLTNPEVDDSTAALLDRVERLERRISQFDAQPPSPPSPAPARAAAPTTSEGTGARPALGAFLAQQPQQPEDPPQPEQQGATAPAVQQAQTPAPTPAPADQPTRDDLVEAWADSILPSLRPRVRAIYQVGRWTALRDGTAVFALPNAAHVQHAAAIENDVSDAISAHFGTRIRLELVTDTDAAPPAGSLPATPTSTPTSTATRQRSAEPPDEHAAAEFDAVPDPDPATIVAEPHDTASWAEHRLREVFPGAEEVSG